MFARRLRFLLYLCVAIAIALLGLVFIKKLIDFPVYYAAGQSLIGGRTDLYAPDFALGRVMDYRYPPVFLLIFLPLWYLPYKVAAYLWYLFSVLQIAASVDILKKVGAVQRLPKKLWLILFFSTAQYFVMILHYGNAHLLAIFLLILSIYFVFIKKEVLAALFFALAIIIKLTPALLLIYFAIRKQWRYLCLVSAFVVVLNIIPAVYFGFNHNLELHKTWFSHVVINQEFHETNGPINLSLKGQLRRYFSEVDYSQRVDGDTRYPTFHLFTLSPQTTDTLWILISLFALGFIVMKILTSTREERINHQEQQSGRIYLLEIGLFICVMLLVGPLTSKIYFIALLVPVFALVIQSENREANKVNKKVLLVIAILNGVLPLLPGRSLQRWLLVLGVDFYVNLLLLAALLYEYLQHRLPSQAPNAEPQRLAP